MNKLKILGYVAIATLCLSFFLSLQECGDKRAENAMLKGREAELMRMMEVNDKEAAKKIVGYEERIAELQGNVDSANTIIKGLEEDVAKKKSENKVLAEQSAILKNEVQPIIDANPRLKMFILRIEEQSANKDKVIFSLTQIIEEKEKIIFSVTEKYELQVKITLEKDSQILSRDELLATRALRIDGVERELRKERAWGAVKKYVAIGALAYVVIDMAASLLAR